MIESDRVLENDGRHGPGNNLFFMIEDPDGYKVEFSAELEHMTKEMTYRTWPTKSARSTCGAAPG
jgi:hypothetical protein